MKKTVKKSKFIILSLVLTFIAVVSVLLILNKDSLNLVVQIESLKPITFESKDSLESIKSAYHSLEDSQKDKVFNYDKFIECVNEYDKLFININKLNDMIYKFEESNALLQSDVDSATQIYNNMSDSEKAQIDETRFLKSIELKEAELAALNAIKIIKDDLKDPNSFILTSAEVKLNCAEAFNDDIVYLKYTGTNSFGGRVSKSSCLVISDSGIDSFYSIARLTGRTDNVMSQNFLAFLQSDSEEIIIDSERIMSNT